MGHTRLGTVPKNRKWIGVVASLQSPNLSIGKSPGLSIEETGVVAQLTLDAVDQGLESAVSDIGLRFTFYLLTQIASSSKDPNWQERLKKIGIELDNQSTLFDLTSEIQYAIDQFISKNGRATDVSEMAQQAIGEAIATLVGPRANTLFGESGIELQRAVKELSTKKGFADLGQKFFGCFMYRFLNFYLSRITATHLGIDNFQKVGDITEFNQALKTHCLQSAYIVHDFCGSWYSKTEYLEGINFRNSSDFLYVALKKLRDEMKVQRTEL